MEMNKLDNILKYLKTIATTIFLMFAGLIMLMAVVQHNVYEDTAKTEAKSDSVEYYLIGILIEKNKYLEKIDPKDYKINLKLGTLYEIYKDYQNAEDQYKLALTKTPFNEYKSAYRLANFYIGRNKLKEAQKLMDEIKEKPNKKLIKDKAEIYFKLGERYYNNGDYSTAIEKYQKSLFYYERLDSKKTHYLNECLASAYTYLADEEINELRMDEATQALLTADSYVSAPITKYKLALLLMKTDPDMAFTYFKAVEKTEPSIIDFDVYYNFLMSMSDASEAVGNKAESEYFAYRARKFKDYFQGNILSVDDIKIELAEGTMKTDRWRKKCNFNVEFKLKNTANSALNSLFVYITFKDQYGTILEYAGPIINVKTPIKSGETSPIINIKTSKNLDEMGEGPNKITAEIYVSKIENSYKIHLITLPITEKTKEAKWKKEARQLFHKFLIQLYLLQHSA